MQARGSKQRSRTCNLDRQWRTPCDVITQALTQSGCDLHTVTINERINIVDESAHARHKMSLGRFDICLQTRALERTEYAIFIHSTYFWPPTEIEETIERKSDNSRRGIGRDLKHIRLKNVWLKCNPACAGIEPVVARLRSGRIEVKRNSSKLCPCLRIDRPARPSLRDPIVDDYLIINRRCRIAMVCPDHIRSVRREALHLIASANVGIGQEPSVDLVLTNGIQLCPCKTIKPVLT